MIPPCVFQLIHIRPNLSDSPLLAYCGCGEWSGDGGDIDECREQWQAHAADRRYELAVTGTDLEGTTRTEIL